MSDNKEHEPALSELMDSDFRRRYKLKRPKITKCPTRMVSGYASMQPVYVCRSFKKKPSLEELDNMDWFVPRVL